MGIELFDEDIDEVYQEFASEPWRHLSNFAPAQRWIAS
jgi:hypothetical protein